MQVAGLSGNGAGLKPVGDSFAAVLGGQKAGFRADSDLDETRGRGGEGHDIIADNPAKNCAEHLGHFSSGLGAIDENGLAVHSCLHVVVTHPQG